MGKGGSMKKYKFLVFIVPLVFAVFCICGEPEYSLAAEPSLVGTWIGSVKEAFSGSQFQLTIVITSDTEQLDTGFHDIEGTVTLSSFPLCFTQGIFSSETGSGRWMEHNYNGTILAIGEGFSQVFLTLDISLDLTQIRILGGGGSGFWDTDGNGCLVVDSGLITKQTTQCSEFAGKWSGSWSETYCDGLDYSGTWTAQVYSDCNVIGTSSTWITVTGTVDPSTGIFTGTGTDDNCGSITLDGDFIEDSVTGSYSYSSGGGGSFIGSFQSSFDNGDGGGDGGGGSGGG